MTFVLPGIRSRCACLICARVLICLFDLVCARVWCCLALVGLRPGSKGSQTGAHGKCFLQTSALFLTGIDNFLIELINGMEIAAIFGWVRTVGTRERMLLALQTGTGNIHVGKLQASCVVCIERYSTISDLLSFLAFMYTIPGLILCLPMFVRNVPRSIRT